MKLIYKRIEEYGLQGGIFYDNETVKGYPSNESMVISFLYIKKDEHTVSIAMSLKKDNSQHVKKIGFSAAYKSLEYWGYNLKCEDSNNIMNVLGHVIDEIVPIIKRTVYKNMSIDGKTLKRLKNLRNSVYYDYIKNKEELYE